ncbi:MAG: hypothetical protein ACE5R7_06670 [Nitrosarchaeum sp.]
MLNVSEKKLYVLVNLLNTDKQNLKNNVTNVDIEDENLVIKRNTDWWRLEKSQIGRKKFA